MSAPQTAAKRLALLNSVQPARPWRSLAEKRLCIVCEEIFRADRIRIAARQTPPRLQCPHCGSSPDTWVRLGDPLLDRTAWGDWQEAMRKMEQALAVH